MSDNVYYCFPLAQITQMKTICFANHKGGVGKTTSTLNVGQVLASRGSRVLLIDSDSQTNLSMSFDRQGTRHLGELLESDGKVAIMELMEPVGEGLHLVAASPRLQMVEKLMAGSSGLEFVLREALETVEDQFDYCLIDTPPSLGGITYSALIAADAVFIPMQPEYFGYNGLTSLLQACVRVRKHYNQKLKVGGIFFTKYSPTYRAAMHHQYVDLINQDEQLAPLVMEVSIRQNTKLGEAQAMQEPILAYAPESNGALDYTALTDEILARL
ncbi:ParA family protein [Hymenobacter amundsenii]|nr:ParA family protein [Hymenobacter amundsenii]